MNLSDVMRHWNSRDSEAVLSRITAALPFWVSLLLVIAIAYQVARLVWLLAPGAPPAAWTPPPAIPAMNSTPAAAGSMEAYAAISRAHLFGQPEALPVEMAGSVDDAPETQLQLQLHGAITAGDEGLAHAIISDQGGKEKVYFIKDRVPGGATLQQVQIDRVILNRGGVLESLLLPRVSSGGGIAPAIPPRSQPSGRIPARRPAAPTADSIAEQVASIADILRPQPFMPNGELKGYRVYPGRNRAQFVALGLRPGDLVTEINGLALNNPAQAMETFRSLAEMTQVTVTLERDGLLESLVLDVNEVSEAIEAAQDKSDTNPAADAVAPDGTARQ